MNWQTLQERWLRTRLIMFHKVINENIAIPTQNILLQCLSTTRSSQKDSYRQIQCNKDSYKFSFFCQTIKDWNKLSPDNQKHHYRILQGYTHSRCAPWYLSTQSKINRNHVFILINEKIKNKKIVKSKIIKIKRKIVKTDNIKLKNNNNYIKLIFYVPIFFINLKTFY